MKKGEVFFLLVFSIGFALGQHDTYAAQISEDLRSFKKNYQTIRCGQAPESDEKKVEEYLQIHLDQITELEGSLNQAQFAVPICRNKINTILQTSKTIQNLAKSISGYPEDLFWSAKAKLIVLKSSQRELILSLINGNDYYKEADNIFTSRKSSCFDLDTTGTLETFKALNLSEENLILAMSGRIGLFDYNQFSQNLARLWEKKAEREKAQAIGWLKSTAKEGTMILGLSILGGYGLVLRAPNLAKKTFTFAKWLTRGTFLYGFTQAGIKGYQKGARQELELSIDELEKLLKYINQLIALELDDYKTLYDLIGHIEEESRNKLWKAISREGVQETANLAFRNERICPPR